MTIDVDGLQTFTLAEQLKLVNHAIAHIMAGGQSYAINGRSYNRADLDKLRDWRRELQTEIDAANTSEGGVALVRFNRPS
jgi:hypothetical protein